MYQDRFIKASGSFHYINKIRNIVTVHRSEISESQFLEKHTAFPENRVLDIIFKSCKAVGYCISQAAAITDIVLYKSLCTQISLRSSKGSEMS